MIAFILQLARVNSITNSITITAANPHYHREFKENKYQLLNKCITILLTAISTKIRCVSFEMSLFEYFFFTSSVFSSEKKLTGVYVFRAIELGI